MYHYLLVLSGDRFTRVKYNPFVKTFIHLQLPPSLKIGDL